MQKNNFEKKKMRERAVENRTICENIESYLTIEEYSKGQNLKLAPKDTR